MTKIQEFKIFGTKTPSETEKEPQIYFSTIFAKNEVVARSRFFNLLRTKHKIKSANGSVLKIVALEEDTTGMKVKNYGIKFVYRSKKGVHNMYKEFRTFSRCDAVEMLFSDMAGRHKVKSDLIYIVDVFEVKNEDVRRQQVAEFCEENVAFPVFGKKLNTRNEFVVKGAEVFN